MARQEDFLFAERALQRGYATEEQVQECLSLLERLREEMRIEETLSNLLVKKGYLAAAQANVLEAEIGKDRADRPKNAIEGYRLLERIGSGAMGSVYRADHLKLKIPVALKVLRPSLSSSRTQIERLKREAQLAARLGHINVVRSLDVGESNGFHYLAMEFVEGVTVRDLLDEGRVPEKEALSIVRQVASGLAHAHAHGVVHRDVKPGNIMIAKDGTAKLGDFGLARGQGPSDLTLEHASIGTPQYVAPEQMRRGSDATPRSDLFSLGATLYHMVTGRPPFHGENLGEIVQNVLACRFEPPESIAPELSRDLVYVIDRLMRGDPRERYASADALVADLDRIGRGEAIAPPDFKGDYHVFLAKRRGRRNSILVACALVLAATGAFVFFRAEGRAKRERLAEACRVADATRADVDSLATVQGLQSAIRDLEKADAAAATAGCGDDAVSNLRARLRSARGAKKDLELAETIGEGSGEPDAHFQDLDRKLAKLETRLPGVRARIDAIRAQIRERSAEAARARYDDRVREEFRDIETAKREAQAFASDLGTRYLPTEADWALDVARAPRVLEDLERRWKAVETARRRFDEALAATPPHYRSAADALKDLRAEEEAALEPLSQSPYLRGLLAHLPDARERETLLDGAERKEWTLILADVASRLEAGKPDTALTAVQRFRERASERTLADVEVRRGEVAKALGSLTESQETLFGDAERTCLGQIRNRAYTSARDGVARDMASGRWVPDVAAKFQKLHDRAQRMTALNARFLERVPGVKKVEINGEDFPGDRIEPGVAKDLFIARGAKRTVEFRLSEVAKLEEILAFGPEDRLLRGWFYAAEAYRWDLSDPYKANELRNQAIGDLGNDPWAAEVVSERDATDQRCKRGEARAQQAEAELAEARKAHDDVKALALAIELSESLKWTRHCKDRLPYFKQQRSELERLAGRGLFLREMGVPPEQLEYGGPEIPGLAAKPTSILLTGRLWHPDPVPEDHPDRAARLEQLALAYWSDWFRSQGKTRPEIADLVPRAMRQLLLWSGPVEIVPDAPGYRPTAAALLESPTQWWGERPERPLPLHLAFPFRADRDWSIELEVEWPGDPGYFVVSAGAIQAVVGYQRIPTRGGMAGACILVGEDLDPGAHAKELGDLHWHMANATKGGKPARRPIESGEKAYLDETNFVPGVPYRMRLARDDETIRFEMWPSGRDDRRITLTKRERADQLGRSVALADGRRVFRFFGVPGKGLGYVLRDVKITGILPERAGGEAKQ